jgi:hypothetical protein
MSFSMPIPIPARELSEAMAVFASLGTTQITSLNLDDLGQLVLCS